MTITPPEDSSVDFTLEVTAGDQTSELDVQVRADADVPDATAANVTGEKDAAVDLVEFNGRPALVLGGIWFFA